MAKNLPKFVCQECGATYNKWAGNCVECGAWDRIIEEKSGNTSSHLKAKNGDKIQFQNLSDFIIEEIRIPTAINEFDRVLGGGVVKGSAILIGGDPGIGKSTLLLQTLAQLALQNNSCIYISGEESIEQVRLRARRLGLEKAPVKLATSTSTSDIVATLTAEKSLDIVVVDSIQTLFVEDYSSAPGTVSQVRASAHELIRIAKAQGFSVFLVGHVTKEGQIAGPKVLEHMVDTVLYFEGERGYQFRILRAVKNRFGAANEIGVFEMQEKGLVEIANPSALFLGERREGISGTVVFAGMEGTRPVFVEIQALIASSSLATPRRAVVGWDANRLAMIIAVLTTRFGLRLMDKEIYLNVAGGLKISEPAADLAVAIALISAAVNVPIPGDCVIFGANINEAIELRKNLPNIDIFVFHGVNDLSKKEFLHYQLIPVLNDFYQIEIWNKFAFSQNQLLPAMLHIDTGMNRLGIPYNQIELHKDSIFNYQGVDFRYLMSHLVCAEEPERPVNTIQLQLLQTIREIFPTKPISLANSSGIFLGEAYHYELTRPGSALYGINPTPYTTNPMRPVVSLYARILQVRELSKKETVGYGGSVTMPAGTRLATVAIGYADGYLRQLSQRGKAYIGGTYIPIVGRVSMDLTIFDITHLSPQVAYPGAEIELLGEHLSIDELAADANTIGYEILTNLGSRYKRVYKGGL